MYDFDLGSCEEVQRDAHSFLLMIKRMMPRWCNSIPDSEFLALVDLIEEHVPQDSPVFVETGVGASTLVFIYYAAKRNGIAYSWDFVGPKVSYIGTVATETIFRYTRKNIFDHWRPVVYNSLSPHAGIPILVELGKRVDMCFLDSEHTLDTLLGELRHLQDLLKEGAVVAIDDGNYRFRYVNVAYVNMIRVKLGLPPISDWEENRSQPFYQEVLQRLAEYWNTVERLSTSYTKHFQEDLFFQYYSGDRRIMDRMGMEKLGELRHRFDAWKVSKRIVRPA
jgi:hypothetical protein